MKIIKFFLETYFQVDLFFCDKPSPSWVLLHGDTREESEVQPRRNWQRILWRATATHTIHFSFFSESRRRNPGWLAKGRNWWDPWSEERDNELFVSNFLPPTRVSSSRPRFQPKRGLGPDSCSSRMIVEEEERENALQRRNFMKKFQIKIILS